MDKPSHLSVIVDLSPTQWALCAQSTAPPGLHLQTFLSQLLAFLNAHIACKDENTLAVFGAFPGQSVMLYSSTGEIMTATTEATDPNTYRPFKTLDSTVMSSIAERFNSYDVTEEEEPIGLVGCLTKALCYINRTISVVSASAQGTEGATISIDPRILVLSVSPDQSSTYIPIMNSIFSAQKLKVTIDVCKVFGAENVFLQQAAHLTGGAYVQIERTDALLQYMMMSFLPPPAIRQLISVPTQDRVDFRAACFCHKRIVEIGFVCSVCLSIFCQPVPVCSTCRTKFPIKTLQRLNASRPLATTPSTPGTPRPLTQKNGAALPRPG
ncbi:transcription factor Tfb4 [Dichomitus squalens LYAD-421 SS1]|uniref:transcription factor Tfb4 n=1 Tax=Dichomitus squalens (strain LYAD-421) TaxID=732165 RepID=UPI0004412008|nr:transcription factor Tfb4 [Dichomitus squalens LYAD-421 SS1]EJF65317.1 transcription factor Tfb4 [Dichomitus squalens LYAD-421 SS1]